MQKLRAEVDEKQKKKNPTQVKYTQTQKSTADDKLKDRLKPKKDFDALPPSIFRKYVHYARKYCNPKMSDEASSILQKFYIKLRQRVISPDSIPVTTRQLESLIRLAQARARIELREEVTVQDAFDVIEIMNESFYDVFTDDKGMVDFRRTPGGSKSKDIKKFAEVLIQACDKKGEAVLSESMQILLLTILQRKS